MFGWVKDIWNFLKRLLRKIFDFIANVAAYFGIDLRKILRNSASKLKTFVNRYVPFLKSSHMRAYMQRVGRNAVDLETKVYIRNKGKWQVESTIDEVDLDEIPPEFREKVLNGKTVDVTQHIEKKLELELAS